LNVVKEAGMQADAAATVLREYAWPGNVRELANAIERSIVLGTDNIVTIDDLSDQLREQSPPAVPVTPNGLGFHDAVAAAKRSILREALRAEGGHQTRAAKRLGLTQPYLARLLKNLQVRSGD
jgi:DNA-binding NtrC family response regulator